MQVPDWTVHVRMQMPVEMNVEFHDTSFLFGGVPTASSPPLTSEPLVIRVYSLWSMFMD